MNMKDKWVKIKGCISVISKIKDLQLSINRLPVSIKNDENGISQKDKRILLQKINVIQKEVMFIKDNIEEES
jgi:hypothetical protein